MVTVDDLVISLTIKETSNLGKLKKQLDQLMSAKVGGKFDFGIPKKLFTDIRYIRESVNYLIPNTLYSFKQKEQFMEQSSRIALQVTKATDQFIDYLFSGEKAETNIERYAKTFGIEYEPGVTPIEDVKKDIEKMLRLYIQKVVERFYMYSEGIGLSKKADAISKTVTDMLTELRLASIDPKTLFTKLYDLLGEDRAFWADFFKKLGAKVEEEVKLYAVRKNFFSKFEELRRKSEKMGDIYEWIRNRDENLDEFFESLNQGQSSMDAVLNILNYLREDFNVGEETLIEALDKLGKDTKVNIMKSMFSVYSRRGERGFKPVLTPKMRKILIEELSIKGIGDLTDLISIDLLIIGKLEDLEESFRKLFDSDKKFLDFALETFRIYGQMFTELKNMFHGTQGEERKMEVEQSVAGETFAVLAEGATEKGIDRLETLSVPFIRLFSHYALEKFGWLKSLKSEEELLKKINNLVEKRTETVNQKLNDVVNLLNESLELIPKEKRKEIEEVIKHINKITKEPTTPVEMEKTKEKTNELLEAIADDLEEGKNLKKLVETILDRLNELGKKVEGKDDELLNALKELKRILESGNLPPRQEPKRGF